jgi:two-component system, cell cycle response regulator
VWEDEGSYYVEDLGSSNGSLLNGRVIERATSIGDGDKIYVGNSVVKFTLVDETEVVFMARMERLAGTDPLTGLHAKHRFDSMLDEHLRSDARPLCLMMMDLDGLKAINDAHGHRMGAHTISLVGRAIGDILGARGEACRFGGDEFCAYLPGLSMQRAKLVAEEIRLTVEESTYTLDEASTQATISIGCARREQGTDTRSRLVALADQALYRAKNAGRNRVCE